MRVTHLGHACLLVESAGRRVLVDPGTLSPAFDDVTDLDAVLVTHVHRDHLDVDRVPALLAANPRAVLHADPASTEALRRTGLSAASPLEPGGELAIGDLRVRVVGELHAHAFDSVERVPNAGLVMSADGEPTLFHPGDALDAEPGAVDVLAHPLSAPWAASRDGVEFVGRIRPRAVVPIHDALLSDAGRGLYGAHVRQLTDLPDLEYVDLGPGESSEL
ncbi:MBL fold metallo-hydrolase [Georgenia sp. Z1491]|uniref:MBL fold metallo-hydrolase n=1 Tax=Georgenia sp. Z1491 TaxID=3416707 RepID=UPI003CF89DE9